VIIVSYRPGRMLTSCLESLREQKTDHIFEVILVDSSGDGTDGLVEERFPWVRGVYREGRLYPGEARNLGVSLARAEVIAFIDSDCTAAPNWVDEIIKAHQSHFPAVGGAISNGDSDSYVGWAAYFTEFSRWMPGNPGGWQEDIAAANMSYRREIFDELGPFIEGTYCSDTDFHWRMKDAGHRLLFVPSILIRHHSIEDLGVFLRHEFFHGRNFARVRVAGRNFSLSGRIFYTLVSPLIAVKLCLRTAWFNLRNRMYLGPFLKTAPLTAAGLVFWTAGEAVGYLQGRR
jgi:GT2 family glycosyltransferase